jgi:hypothetical protein
MFHINSDPTNDISRGSGETQQRFIATVEEKIGCLGFMKFTVRNELCRLTESSSKISKVRTMTDLFRSLAMALG